ncbi:MAG: Uma2 family endonuclease [Pirellulaceae bacterium]|nr:Uma2 family endonuclease [Pirellulaceae bacterium]
MSTVLKGVTLAEYEAHERASEIKSEYYRGEIFAMAGGSANHGLIAANIVRELGNALKDRPCRVFNSDLRVKVEETGLYTYPDVSVVCGPLQYDNDVSQTVTNPILLVEVLSDASESYDRGTKATHYRRILSLQEFVLVSQKSSAVETLVRQAAGAWLLREACRLEEHIRFQSLDLSLALSEIYRGVTFDPDAIMR